ncbi:MAG: hypothetical protein K6F71_08735 [Ruminococcus sp.]|uniref:hypothetical protein n=1 Tax=Ruminococcus sp. TaxID=41978 RepID=UPI0025D6EE25|nr:hypothetical protein [Ruminococcus sp.]MCR5540882.1 hypothetical protein [Ruminococcus sp.]
MKEEMEIPQKYVEKIKKTAEQQGVSVDEIVETAIKNFLETAAETTTAPIEISEPKVTVKPEISEKEKKELENNVFMTEFFNSSITFIDRSDIADSVLKTCSFEHLEVTNNGAERISLSSESGSGIVDMACIDLTTSELDCGPGYMIDSVGDYYYGLTKSSMQGVTDNDFNTNYRMTNTVVSKGKYQQYGSMQRSDGMATQFGYAETYATLVDNKLTIVSGQFVSRCTATCATERTKKANVFRQQEQ